MADKTISGQERLEAHVDKTMREHNVEQKGIVNELMRAEKVSCSYADNSITLAFPVQPWQANRVGNMHGGMICTALDSTMATLARFYAQEFFAPTISIDVKYIRPVKVGDRMLVTASATAAGKRITQLTCEAYSESSGKLVATGASVYLNVDTVKEREG